MKKYRKEAQIKNFVVIGRTDTPRERGQKLRVVYCPYCGISLTYTKIEDRVKHKKICNNTKDNYDFWDSLKVGERFKYSWLIMWQDVNRIAKNMGITLKYIESNIVEVVKKDARVV